MPTLFSHIISGDLPASMVYRDDLCVAFMDIHPMSRGHTLVVPLQAVATLGELPVATRKHLWEIAHKVGLAQRAALGSGAQHLLINDGRVASQSVPHVHIHVIPRYRGDGLKTLARMIAHVGVIAIPLPITARKRRHLDQIAERIRSSFECMATHSD